MIGVSIIVPVYNKERFLRQCLDSLLDQTYRAIEIICVNDGSTDGSLEILQDYAERDNRIVLIDQENKGAGNARNAGIRIARGRYLQFLDADDFFEPVMIENMLKKAEAKDADIVICNALLYDNETQIKEAHAWLSAENIEKDPFSAGEVENIFKITQSTIWNKLYKRAFIVNNDIWYQEITSNNDTAFSIVTLFLAERITYVDAFYILYRDYNDQSRISSSREKHMNCCVLAYKEVLNQLKTRGKYSSKAKDVLNMQMYNSCIYELSFCKKRSEGMEFIKQMAKLMSNPEKMKLLYFYEKFTNMRIFYLFGCIPVMTSVNLANEKKVFYLFNVIPVKWKKREQR